MWASVFRGRKGISPNLCCLLRSEVIDTELNTYFTVQEIGFLSREFGVLVVNK